MRVEVCLACCAIGCATVGNRRYSRLLSPSRSLVLSWAMFSIRNEAQVVNISSQLIA
jgi:hypothetical protein